MSGLARKYKRALRRKVYEDDMFHRKPAQQWLNIQRERIQIIRQMRGQAGQQPVEQRKGR